ncbi:hypothetical protein HA466_0165910 [Hirschfeldia incana]|nr:hypothetical protein HA466_0165910 [Hirschfeldia incana]
MNRLKLHSRLFFSDQMRRREAPEPDSSLVSSSSQSTTIKSHSHRGALSKPSTALRCLVVPSWPAEWSLCSSPAREEEGS